MKRGFKGIDQRPHDFRKIAGRQVAFGKLSVNDALDQNEANHFFKFLAGRVLQRAGGGFYGIGDH